MYKSDSGHPIPSRTYLGFIGDILQKNPLRTEKFGAYLRSALNQRKLVCMARIGSYNHPTCQICLAPDVKAIGRISIVYLS